MLTFQSFIRAYKEKLFEYTQWSNYSTDCLSRLIGFANRYEEIPDRSLFFVYVIGEREK